MKEVYYPLAEILLVILVGFLCRAEGFDEMEYLGTEELTLFRKLLPFAPGVAPAQTMRLTLARLNPRQLETAFARRIADRATDDLNDLGQAGPIADGQRMFAPNPVKASFAMPSAMMISTLSRWMKSPS